MNHLPARSAPLAADWFTGPHGKYSETWRELPLSFAINIR